MRLKVRSLAGWLPLCASTVFEGDPVTRYPRLMELIALFRQRHPELVAHVAPTDTNRLRSASNQVANGIVAALDKDGKTRILSLSSSSC
jgi:hypothetical protein